MDCAWSAKFFFVYFSSKRAVLEVLTDTNPKSFDVGEIFVLEALASGESRLIILVLEHWITTNEVNGITVNESASLKANLFNMNTRVVSIFEHWLFW